MVAGEPGVVLSDGGRSDYTIVVASNASDSEKHGAKELQMFLEQISGAKLPIATDADGVDGPMVLVGRSKKVDALEKIDFETLGDEGFVLRTVPPHLVLAGGRQRGSLYAVYTFLEDQLGCRWFTPTASRIPKRERIAIGPLQVRQAPPPIEFRSITLTDIDPDWAARNKLNAGMQRIEPGDVTGWGYLDLEETRGGARVWKGSHTFHDFLPSKEYFDEHPEYFALSGGKRSTVQLCLTQPEVVKIVAKDVKERLRTSPRANIIAVGQNDGFGGWCECPGCAALDEKEDSHSATLINFVNQVADIVGEEFPDVAIGTWSYLYTKKPPKTIRPRPNVIVAIAPIQNCLSHPAATDDVDHTMAFRDHLAAWSKLTDRLYFWDYVTCFHHFLLPFPNFDALQPNLQLYVDNGVRGVFYQTNSTGAMKELRNYVLAKCLWNPATDALKVRNEFLEGYYGPAAPPIREYHEMIHKKARDDNIHIFIWTQPTEAYLTPEILSRARELFDEAQRRVEGQPELVERVEIARLAIQYTELCRPSPYVDSAPIYAKFKAVVDRENQRSNSAVGKLSYAGEAKTMAEWLAERDALYGRLPENVVYDLYQNLSRAKAENCRMFEAKSVKKDGATLLTLLQHPPDEGLGDATFEIPLPALENGKKLILRFGTCFSDPTANGVGFTVLVDGKEVWSVEQKDLAPADHQVDLSGSAGKTISLTLRVDALGNGAYDWSCWVRPQVQTLAENAPE
jgi:hypothetical protein